MIKLFRGAVEDDGTYRKAENTGGALFGAGTYFTTKLGTAMSYSENQDAFLGIDDLEGVNKTTGVTEITSKRGKDERTSFVKQVTIKEEDILEITNKLLAEKTELMLKKAKELKIQELTSEIEEYHKIFSENKAIAADRGQLSNFTQTFNSPEYVKNDRGQQGKTLAEELFGKKQDIMDFVSEGHDAYSINQWHGEKWVLVKESGRDRILNNQKKYLGKDYRDFHRKIKTSYTYSTKTFMETHKILEDVFVKTPDNHQNNNDIKKTPSLDNKIIDVKKLSQEGVPKSLLQNPVTNSGEMNKMALKALHIKSFGKENKNTVLDTFKKYQEKEKNWLAEGKYDQKKIADKKNDAVKKTVENVLRFDFLGSKKDSYDKEESEKMCCLSTTSAKDPDPEHSLLEYVPLRCSEVMEYLQRFGCQHDYLELDDEDVKKLRG